MVSNVNNDLISIWGHTSSDIFAVGRQGTIVHYNGSNWQSMNSGTTNDLWSIWGSSGSDVFVAGAKGTILHYDGVSWMTMVSPTTTHFLLGVWGSSDSDVFVVGYPSGVILHYPSLYPPWVVSTFPADKAVGAKGRHNNPSYFSEDIDPSTVTSDTFMLSDGTATIAGRMESTR